MFLFWFYDDDDSFIDSWKKHCAVHFHSQLTTSYHLKWEHSPLWGSITVQLAVWPDVGIKSSPFFQKIFKIAQKVLKYVGNLNTDSWSPSFTSLDSTASVPVWPDLAIFWTLGNFLKPLATINLPKSPTFLGKFCKCVKIFHFSCEIIFGELLYTFGDSSGQTVQYIQIPTYFP